MKTCGYCKKEFEAKHHREKYCCEECKRGARALQDQTFNDGRRKSERGQRTEEPEVVFQNQKQFDLRVGDIVVANEKELSVRAKYEVIGIYENVFRCKKISGLGKWLTSFCKTDYCLGEIQKVVR